jgi:hypothetical protein
MIERSTRMTEAMPYSTPVGGAAPAGGCGSSTSSSPWPGRRGAEDPLVALAARLDAIRSGDAGVPLGAQLAGAPRGMEADGAAEPHPGP